MENNENIIDEKFLVHRHMRWINNYLKFGVKLLRRKLDKPACNGLAVFSLGLFVFWILVGFVSIVVKSSVVSKIITLVVVALVVLLIMSIFLMAVMAAADPEP